MTILEELAATRGRGVQAAVDVIDRHRGQDFAERMGLSDHMTVTAVCCELCGTWVPVAGATIADVRAGRITVPEHAMDRERDGMPCEYAGAVVRP